MPLTHPHVSKITQRLKNGSRSRINALVFLLVVFLVSSYPVFPGYAMKQAQETSAHDKAMAMLESLTPQEKVGQLFLVTFKGTDVGPDSQVYDLINNHHIGGVVLQAKNDNFVGDDQALTEAQTLTRQIQLDRWTISQKTRVDPVTNEEYQPRFVPLFIALSQEGDGYPYDQILTGITPLPNEMAIGATWNPELALQVGSVLGQELSSIGVNMLFGPSLDVLEIPHVEGSNDLGTRAFSGDPFWVSKMGSSFIQGVHQGSGDHVAVVATHFPGFGASDRLPEEEVATVRKQLEQLKSFDLIPFFDVTGNAASPDATTDALLVSHIRYQGFQGNIRLTTRPLSFDPQAFNQLMDLPQLNAWQNNGGVMVSDDLGSRAVRGYYDLTSQTFDMPRRVALSAFQAGNDLLYVADFSSGDLDSYTSAVQTLDFFTQKYREDTFFAQRVDQAVGRILELKYRLYGDFGLNQVLTSQDSLDQIGQSGQVTVEVARQAATLISPTQAELDDTVPDPPNRNDRIVFFTDARTGAQCSNCQPEPLLDIHALERVVLRRYGPQAGGQVVPNNLSSYSLTDLQLILNSGVGDSDLERDLSRANWIVFAMLNSSPDLPSFNTLKQFLSERPDFFQKKRLIVFAFNAPYYLDATNISKLTAYYGLYSKASQFIDVAAYLLFQELRPNGALPISVMGVYDLNTMLTPDPDQVINLRLDIPGEEVTSGTSTPEPQVTEHKVGDVISIRTDMILDHNGNPVPDGTPVEFIIGTGGNSVAPRQLETTTSGIARTSVQASNSGALEVRVVSEPAKQSNTLHFDIQSDNLGSIPATATLEPSPTPTEPPTPTVVPTIQTVEPVEPPSRPQFADWIMAVLVSAAISWSAYRLSALIGQVRWGVRSGFLTMIGGLLAYSYLALQMPGSEELLKNSVSRGVFLITLLGAGLGLLITWLWRALSSANEESSRNLSS